MPLPSVLVLPVFYEHQPCVCRELFDGKSLLYCLYLDIASIHISFPAHRAFYLHGLQQQYTQNYFLCITAILNTDGICV